jgi:hypothetical protein
MSKSHIQRRLDRKAWIETYEVTSVKGRIWTRSMVRSGVLRLAAAACHKVDRASVDQVLDDSTFMIRRRGEIPARVIEAVLMEAVIRSRRNRLCERCLTVLDNL